MDVVSGTSRNAPCPCGSGKKFKHCHLGKEDALTEEGKTRKIILTVVAIGLIAFVGMMFTVKGFSGGVASLVGGLIVFGTVAVLTKPPPATRNKEDGAAIDFGTRG